MDGLSGHEWGGPGVSEKSEDVRGLKREIAQLKREAKAAQRALVASRKAKDDAETARKVAIEEVDGLKKSQSERTRDSKLLRQQAVTAKADGAQLKDESSELSKKLVDLEKDLEAAQARADNLSKELKVSKEETGQLQKQVGAATTSGSAAKTTGADPSTPTSNPDTEKEMSTMSPQSEPAVEDHIVHYEHAKSAIKQQSRLKANQIVATYSAVGAGVGIVPVAVIDIAGLGAVQLVMLSKLADAYGVKYSGNLGRTILSAILGSLIPTSLKVSTIGLIRSVPLFGPLLGLVTMPAYCWSVTYAIGTVFTELFERDGDLENLDVEDTKAKVKKVLATVSPKQAETAAKAA